jgi:hypothetical protein
MQCDRLKRYLGPVLLHFLKDAFTGRGVVGESSDMILHDDEGDDDNDDDKDDDDDDDGRAELSSPIPVYMSCHVMSYLLYLAASTSHMFIQEAREVSTTT